jgi:type IV pilus assembly protein PilM
MKLPKFSLSGPESFVAIDLGNHCLKGLVVEQNKVRDFFLKGRHDLSSALRQVWQEKKIPTDRVKLSLKDPATLVRYFSFPNLEKKKMKQTLFYELNKHIPFPPDEVYFDFSILKETHPGEVFLVLAVAKKDFINLISDIFAKEKLKILEITLDSVCLMNLFLEANPENKINSCILDVGSSFSTLTILQKRIPYLTRDLAFSTKDIINLLSNIKNIPLPEIEKWLISEANHPEVLGLVQDNIAALCKEVKNSFNYFEVNKGERIEKLYLAGGITYITDIAKLFKDELDLEVGFLDIPPKINISCSKEKFNAVKNSFTAALGLVL